MIRLRSLTLLAVWQAGCNPSESPEPKVPIAVIDTLSGQIVERWDAPKLTFDVAFDDVGNSLWAISEYEADYRSEYESAPRIWELRAGEAPQLWHTLPEVWQELSVYPHYWIDFGAVAVDTTARRGAFTSPRSKVLALIDLDTGALVREIVSLHQSHGTAFDSRRGIGYESISGLPFAYRSSDGDLLGTDLCSPGFGGPGLTLSSSGILYAPTYNFDAAGDTVCRFDPDVGAELLPNGFGCDGGYCSTVGVIVSPDASTLFVATPKIDSSATPSFHVRGLTGGYYDEVMNEAGPQGFELTPDGSTLFVSQIACERIAVYDASPPFVHLYDIALDGEALGMDLSADGSRLFVAQADPNGALGHRKSFLDGISNDRDLVCPPIVPPP